MATWQESNGGGFLAGIGRQNDNAPQARDINTTLGMIRDNNDISRSGANNVGLTGLRGLAGVADAYQQERKQEFQQKYANAFKSGDRNVMRDLMAQYPEQYEAVRNGMGFIDDDQRNTIGNLATKAQLASAQGPGAFGRFISDNAADMQRVGLNPSDVVAMQQQDPSGFSDFAGNLALFSLGHDKYFDVLDKQQGRQLEQGRLNESIRSNKASEANTIRGQNITMRGQDISAQNSMRSAGGSVPSSVREYQYFNSLSPEQQQTYLRVRGRPGGDADNTVQLADGRTVTVAGKLHGSGANAFYEGRDDNGNMVRVPASSISAPPTSAASAQNYAMKKDIDAIANADTGNLDFMTGVTGGSGNPAIGADVRSRIGGKEQRQLYNAARRVQGRMQNQGVAAARDMGASGINTVAEAKMYFQGMPQVDYSSPEAMQQSIRDISEYTNNYNQQYQVSVGGRQQAAVAGQQAANQQPAGGRFTSKSGITFTVK
ncbi:TPA: phage DNA ejection protein [Pluralibacter gergoviae]|nr:phage DNA ejection protein [Pluralibacter gergoviae]HDS1241458.1 phage DNA ejection protein [Pluralibacter gergoviae]HDS1248943.1 phage DNA ejection protein [Pluralibacter gergoviae]HDS1254135.1 phage DNA ejection protein [Pluralibacter gergoviae]HDS1257644.1 phage DNA ejection protein [Pluralibacter gergoviae]